MQMGIMDADLNDGNSTKILGADNTSELKVNADGSINTVGSTSVAQTPLAVTGTLSSNTYVEFDNSTVGYGALGIQITGTWSGTLTPSVSIDGTNFSNVSMHNFSGSFHSTETSNDIFYYNLGGVKKFRITMSSYVSGTANISFFATMAKAQGEIVSISQTTSAAGVSNSTLVPTIETEHNKIHQGKMFHIAVDTTLANNGTWKFLFTPGSSTAHLIYNFFTNGVVDFHIYENPTGVTTSTSYTPYNRSRESSTAAGTTFQLVTAVTGNGTEITDLLFGSSGGGNSATQIGRAQEWDFPNGKTYLFEITSNSAGNNVTLWLDWYEG